MLLTNLTLFSNFQRQPVKNVTYTVSVSMDQTSTPRHENLQRALAVS